MKPILVHAQFLYICKHYAALKVPAAFPECEGDIHAFPTIKTDL